MTMPKSAQTKWYTYDNKINTTGIPKSHTHIDIHTSTTWVEGNRQV